MKKWKLAFSNVNKENELCPVCGLPLNSCVCEEEPEPEPVCPNTPECNIVTCTCGTTYCSTHITHSCITLPGGLVCDICGHPRDLGSIYCSDHKGKYCEKHTGELLENGKCRMCGD